MKNKRALARNYKNGNKLITKKRMAINCARVASFC
jgi:hypothetical protein